VRLTSSIFFWHMSGLAFIAMNRVMAPAFYARGDTKTPTWAGLISVAINIGLAFALVGPLKAPGIALALSGASAANTLVLAVPLLRSRIPGTREALAASGRYSLKLILFSVLAALPVIFLRPFLAGRFAGWNRTLASGESLVLTAIVFGGVGIALLGVSRDEMASSMVHAFRRRAKS
jgi:putative peptidoglycan lipid II flippase